MEEGFVVEGQAQLVVAAVAELVQLAVLFGRSLCVLLCMMLLSAG